MSATPSGPLRKTAAKVFKSSIESPLNLKWPEVPAADADDVKRHLAGYLSGCNTGRKPVRDKKTSAASSEAQDTRDAADVAAIRGALAVGVNECTRCLEKDQLALLLVCRSCPLPALSRHLLPLAATRSCTAGAIPGLSEHVAPLIGVQKAIAIGVKVGEMKEGSGVLDDLIAHISPKLPSVAVPWLRGVRVTMEARTGDKEVCSDSLQCSDAPPPKKPRALKQTKEHHTVQLKYTHPPRLEYLNLAIKTHTADPQKQLKKAQRKQARKQLKS